VTAKGPYVDLKWAELISDEAYLKRPYVKAEDITGDGKPELVVEEQVHNGNMYNGVVYHYYEIGQDMALHHIFALETRVFDIRSEEGPENAFFVRKLESKRKGRIRIRTSIDSKSKSELLGSVDLVQTAPGKAFKVLKRRCANDQDCGNLITCSEFEEQKFIENGYNFYY
jgi:hypothetical protein